MYLYIQTEPQLWTTGHRDPSGVWHPDLDCESPAFAAARVAWLNGSGDNPGNEIEWQKRQAGAEPKPAPQSAIDCTALYTEIENMREEVSERDALIKTQKAMIDDLQVKLAVFAAGIDMAIDESTTYLRKRQIGIDDVGRITAIRAGLMLTVARVDNKPAGINEWLAAASVAAVHAA
jgi:hypothetical protein